MTDGFWPAAAGWALRTAVAGGVVLLIGWVCIRLTKQPARRQRLAAWTVRAAVLAAVLSLLPGWLRVSPPTWATEEKTWPAPVAAPSAAVDGPVEAEPDPSVPALQPLQPAEDNAEWVWALVPVGEEPPDAPGGVDPPAPAVPTPPAAAPPATPADRAAELAPFVLVPYGVLAAVGLMQVAAGQLALARLRRSGKPAPPVVQALFDGLTAGLPVAPRLLVSEVVPSPVCFGVTRPTVLLPRALVRAATTEQIRWVLAHELDHLRRGDARVGVWAALARAVYFFLPWYWAVRRELRLAQEYLADAAAAAAGGRPVDYAAFLVDLSARPGRHPLGATGVRAGKSDLYRRVAMLVKVNDRMERTAPRGWSLLTAGGVLSLAVVLSGVGLADDKKDEAVKERVEAEIRLVQAKKAEAAARASEADAKKKAETARQGEVEARKKAEAAEIEVVVIDDGKADPAKPATVREIRRTGVNKEEVAKLKAAVEAAAKKGDIEAVRDAVEKLEKALAATPRAVTLGRIADPAAPPVPPVPGVRFAPLAAPAPMRVRVAVVDEDLAGLEKAAEKLKKAAEELKDQPEARAAIEKSLSEYKKKIAEARAKGEVPPAPPAAPRAPKAPPAAVAPIPPQVWGLQGQLMDQQKAILDQVHKQLEQEMAKLKDNPEAAEALKKALVEAHKHLAQQAQNLPKMEWKAFPAVPDGQNMEWKVFPAHGAAAGDKVRLGIVPETIPAALAAQLDLPKGVGVVVVDVVKGTPAEKAGVKVNDVLVRIGDRDVPGEPGDVVKMVAGLKAGTVDVVVVRKGKKETLKGLTLPEAPKPEALKKYRVLGDKVSGEKKVKFNSMAVSVNDDEFNIKAESEGTRYVIEGAMKDGKAAPATIRVTAGDKKTTYSSLEKVPAEHRAAVEQLLGNVGSK